MSFTLGGCEVKLPTEECVTDAGEDTCTASVVGHRCCLDNGDLDHFPKTWDGEGHWLLAVRHRCGCHPPAEWPEAY